MSSDLILVVCTANVCRSPFAEMLMKADLDASGIRVESAGTHAHDGDAVCSLVAGHRSTREWAELAASHGACAVSREMLDEAALILTASREVRGEVVRLSPAVRDRTYTLREAAYRGSRFERRTGGVAEYASHLDRARSSLAPAPVARGLRRRGRDTDDAMSIADRHGGSARAHARTLKDVAEAAEAIIAQLNRVPSR
ncbi:arsenate reductase/protein-tyrosine-phosphatase family protein [Microbacterium tumbae]